MVLREQDSDLSLVAGIAICQIILAAMLLITIVQFLHADDLAKQSQNPLGTVISLPFENNLYTGIGPSESLVNALNMKPAYPVRIGQWNLINRFILPVLYSEGQDVPVPAGTDIDAGYAGVIEMAQGSAFGLGDLTY